MNRVTLLLLITSFLLNISQAIETTSLAAVPNPGQPTDVVCIQIVCPDPGVDDPTQCPERCNGKCHTIQNACCPQSQVAVCDDDPNATSGVVPTTSGGNSEPTSSASPVPTGSGSASDGGSASVTSSAGGNASASTNPEESSSNGLKLPYFVLPLFIVLVTKLLFL